VSGNPSRRRQGASFDHVVVGASPCALAYAWRRLGEGRRVLVATHGPDDDAPAVQAFDAFVEGDAPHLEALLAALRGEVAFARPPAPPGALAVWARAGLRRPPATFLEGVARRPGLLLQRLRRGAPHAAPTPRWLAGGTSPLRAALGVRVGTALGAELRVTEVEPRPSFDGRCRVRLEEGEPLAAREVALDLPAFEQARLLAAGAPNHADVLAAVCYEPLVEIVAKTSATLPPVAGFVRAPGTRGRVRDALFLTSLGAEGGAHLAARLGGLDDPGALDLDDDLLSRTVAVDLGRALGRRADVEILAVTRRERARPRPAPGHRRRVARLAAALGGRGVRLLGSGALGTGLDRIVSAAFPVPGALPGDVTVA